MASNFKVRPGYAYQVAEVPAVPHSFVAAGSNVSLDSINQGGQAWKLQEATPPAEVSGLSGTPGNTTAKLDWTDPVDADFVSVKISAPGVTTATVLKGVQTKTFTGLTNDAAKVFTLKTVDKLGNESAGVTQSVTPTAG